MVVKNRFKKAKKEEAIKTIFSSDVNTNEEKNLESTITENTELNKNLDNSINEDTNIEIPKKQNVTATDEISKISDKVEAPTVIKMDKLGVSIKTSSKKRLDKLSTKLRRKPNNVVTLLLDNLYDEDTKSFKVDVAKKDTSKITSYHMKKDHINAINKLSKKTGYNKSEIFNILLELALTIEED